MSKNRCSGDDEEEVLGAEGDERDRKSMDGEQVPVVLAKPPRGPPAAGNSSGKKQRSKFKNMSNVTEQVK